MKPPKRELKANTIPNLSEIDLKQFSLDVHGNIKTIMTADYTMAVLTEKEQQSIVKMVRIAGMVKRIMSKYANEPYYEWDNYKKIYTRKEQPKEITDKIENNAIQTHLMIMSELDSMVILKRNTALNFILKLIIQQAKEEEQNEEQTKGMIQKLVDKLKPQKNESS